MKSYNHLMEKTISDENIMLAIRNSTRGKRKRPRIKELFENAINHIRDFKDMANFKNDHHKPKEIYDGISRKRRTIIVPSTREQVVHHMIVNVIKPIFTHGMYEHAYGSLPHKGAHKAKKVMAKWLKDNKNNKYVMKLDIRKYFESIPHDILKAKLNKLISDKAFLKLIFEVIDVTDKGLPLGFYTSQWFSMWYLKDFDHYVKEVLGAKYYMRYMDDMVILGSNKRELSNMLAKIKVKLAELGLELNNKSQIFRFDYYNRQKDRRCGRDIDYMGFRFYRDKTILRKSILYKMTRKARKIHNKSKATIHDLRQMLSHVGWTKHCQIYNVWVRMVKPCFNVRNAKKRISNYDRRENRCLLELKIAIA